MSKKDEKELEVIEAAETAEAEFEADNAEEPKEKTKKQKIKKILLKILIALVILIVLVIAITAIVNSEIKKSNMNLVRSFKNVEVEDRLLPVDKDGYYTFTTDRDLKILQLTDVHIGGGWMSAEKDVKAINAVAAMITAEKPDLVVVTGDIAFPVPFISGTLNNKTGAEILANLMESLGVYWVPVFGNHDTEAYSYYNREQISKFYSSDNFQHCLFKAGNENVSGYGNSAILVKNSKGVITQSIFLFDSHSYTDGDFFGIDGKYDNMHDDQMEWYKTLVNDFSAQNRSVIEERYFDEEEKATALENFGTIPSIAFYHIPSEEYKTAWDEYYNNNKQDTENVKYFYGDIGEKGAIVCCGVHPDNFFETLVEVGSTKGVFCGHDHLNTYSLEYKGIRLTYGYSIDYLAYSGISDVGSQRGCTIITVSPDGSFTCEGSSYYQDKYETLNGYQKETVTMQDLEKEAYSK